jgi:hypothetical protein
MRSMMREEQQYQMLESLIKIWSVCPQQRLGQLIVNLTREQGTGRLRDPFTVSDEELSDIMRSIIRESNLGV